MATTYVNSKDTINDFMNRIYALSKILSFLEDYPEKQIEINAQAIGKVGRMIANDACTIERHLEVIATASRYDV